MGNPLIPQIMAIHICKYDGNSTTTVCSCAFHSWPPPDIQWYMNHQHLTKKNISGNVKIISSTQGNTITSSIYLLGNTLNYYIISCRGINPIGFSNLKTLSIPAKKGFCWTIHKVFGIHYGL
uniref:Ig-like domain-containing protein n=1 Tax=Laticauda laticaudata TaxID=8630 RepID=A0A8C5WWF0_LATLA